MQTGELNDAENKLINCVASGLRCQFDKDLSPPVIRASVLRNILLGIPVLGGEETIVVPIFGPGLILSGARVEGLLDLRYGATVDGGHLPPLQLENCFFEHQIDLTSARLRGLSLYNSRLIYLRANHAKIQGTLNVGGVRTSQNSKAATGADGEGLCWIDLRGAAIDGDLDAGVAALVAPPARPAGSRSDRDARYALDMRGARISGTIRLQPSFHALGGVALRLALIEGDILCGGANLTALEEHALDATGAEVGGFLSLGQIYTDQGELRPFGAQGNLWFQGAKIGKSLNLAGADISGEIIAPNVKIGIHAHFTEGLAKLPNENSERHPFRFSFLNLYGASINGTLTIRPGILPKESERVVNLSFARVGTLRDSCYSLRAAGVRLLMEGLSYDNLVTDRQDVSVEKNLISRYSEKAFKWLTKCGLSMPSQKKGLEFLSVSGTIGFYICLIWFLGSLTRIIPGDFWTCLISLLAVALFNWLSSNVRIAPPVWRRRLIWLNLQHKNGIASRESYSPYAYEQLIRQLRSSGEFDGARHIASERLSLERRLLSPLPLRLPLWLFDKLFDHGLSSARALTIFGFCILVGAAGVDIADNGMLQVTKDYPVVGLIAKAAGIDITRITPVLVVDTSTVNTAVAIDPLTKLPVSTLMGPPTSGNIPLELPCKNLIDPGLYAIDIFVPALELHQEAKCSIMNTPAAQPWRWAQAIYAVLGWIITALVILTVSGIFRRRAES